MVIRTLTVSWLPPSRMFWSGGGSRTRFWTLRLTTPIGATGCLLSTRTSACSKTPWKKRRTRTSTSTRGSQKIVCPKCVSTSRSRHFVRHRFGFSVADVVRIQSGIAAKTVESRVGIEAENCKTWTDVASRGADWMAPPRAFEHGYATPCVRICHCLCLHASRGQPDCGAPPGYVTSRWRGRLQTSNQPHLHQHTVSSCVQLCVSAAEALAAGHLGGAYRILNDVPSPSDPPCDHSVHMEIVLRPQKLSWTNTNSKIYLGINNYTTLWNTNERTCRSQKRVKTISFARKKRKNAYVWPSSWR
eukprot:12457_6